MGCLSICRGRAAKEVVRVSEERLRLVPGASACPQPPLPPPPPACPQKLDLGQCAQPQLSLAMYSSRALVENMQQLEAKAQAASAPEPTCANAGITAGVRGGNFGGSGGKNGGTSGLPTNGSRGGARGIAAVAGQQAGPVQFLVEIKLDGEGCNRGTRGLPDFLVHLRACSLSWRVVHLPVAVSPRLQPTGVSSSTRIDCHA